MFGLAVERTAITDVRSVIGEVSRSMAGNVVLRIGRENTEPNEPGQPYGWHQTEHVVLAPDEARELVDAIQVAGGQEVDRIGQWVGLSFPTFLDLAIEATDPGVAALEGATDFLKLGRLVAEFFAADVERSRRDATAREVE